MWLSNFVSLEFREIRPITARRAVQQPGTPYQDRPSAALADVAARVQPNLARSPPSSAATASSPAGLAASPSYSDTLDNSCAPIRVLTLRCTDVRL